MTGGIVEGDVALTGDVPLAQASYLEMTAGSISGDIRMERAAAVVRGGSIAGRIDFQDAFHAEHATGSTSPGRPACRTTAVSAASCGAPSDPLRRSSRGGVAAERLSRARLGGG
jgi:hypothetical protein